jgi:hypothetical protein
MVVIGLDDKTLLKDVVSAEDLEKLVQGMLKSNVVAELYNDYIKKDIPFEEWIRGMIDCMYVDSDKPSAGWCNPLV